MKNEKEITLSINAPLTENFFKETITPIVKSLSLEADISKLILIPKYCDCVEEVSISGESKTVKTIAITFHLGELEGTYSRSHKVNEAVNVLEEIIVKHLIPEDIFQWSTSRK